MITFAPYPIPVNTQLGEGYVIYVESSSMLENDVWTICLCESGIVKHFTTDQITISKNYTFQINEKKSI